MKKIRTIILKSGPSIQEPPGDLYCDLPTVGDDGHSVGDNLQYPQYGFGNRQHVNGQFNPPR